MGDKEFAGKVGLVTGAGQGIGREIALSLARAGAAVAALDRDATSLQEVVSEISREGGRGEAMELDLRDVDALPGAFERLEASLGPIDVLVNNAAVVLARPFLETGLESLREMMSVNLEAPFLCAQLVARSMIRRGLGGRIVNLASHSGLLGSTERAAYAASKGALISVTRVMAVELADHNITVNAIAPGPVESAHTKLAHSAERREAWRRVVPLGRYADAREVAAAVLFLASDGASFITGHTLAVDGGFTAAGLVTR